MKSEYRLAQPPTHIDGWEMIETDLAHTQQVWRSPCGALIDFKPNGHWFNPQAAQEILDKSKEEQTGQGEIRFKSGLATNLFDPLASRVKGAFAIQIGFTHADQITGQFHTGVAFR